MLSGNRVGSVEALRREFLRGLPRRRWAVRVGKIGISGGRQRMAEVRDEEGGNHGGQGVCREEGGEFTWRGIGTDMIY